MNPSEQEIIQMLSKILYILYFYRANDTKANSAGMRKNKLHHGLCVSRAMRLGGKGFGFKLINCSSISTISIKLGFKYQRICLVIHLTSEIIKIMKSQVYSGNINADIDAELQKFPNYTIMVSLMVQRLNQLKISN
ncbi:hypothetical protein WN51_05165 [Melipona quadrifasciata]|uniref:Uncharacterized protein n=1 Tax=Melipona quadrifasciata TaxID=166423 RepID=A0A0M8ZRG2_9HYME|nr:hypothetical protein WN51_05165 [Melipona quadrifasciata]